jgi:hypothetical protein
LVGLSLAQAETMANSAATPINPKMSNARRDSKEEVALSENASTKVEETAKESKLKAGWAKLGLDAGTILMMFKVGHMIMVS